MSVPTTVAELLVRARSASGNNTRYGLGRGGRNPNARRPDQEGRCDCSGYVAWCLGFDRYLRNPFYARINGENGRGWFETTAAWQDIGEPAGILRPLSGPVVGAIAVYPDSHGSEGHIGIVTEVKNGVATKFIHCSGSASRAGDAIAENSGSAFTRNGNTRYGWYESITDRPEAHTVSEWPERPASPRRRGSASAAAHGARVALRAVGDEALQLLYAPRDSDGSVLYRIYIDPAKTMVWQARAHICADGCPQAYHPSNTGLDHLRAAGKPRPGAGGDHCRWNWWGIAVRPNGCPYVQSRQHPFPGYYVSTTAHVDSRYPASDPARFVDADEIPYLVLPAGRTAPARKGDYGFIVHRPSGRGVPVIYAEVGPAGETGELSIAAARRLGVDPNPRTGGSERRDFLYLTFTGSGPGNRWDAATIESEATALFNRWGGMARVGRTPQL